jgi:hypothetical protein
MVLLEGDMSNMSYCRFQNTSNDLADCTAELEDMLDEQKSLATLSKDEKRSAAKMRELCEQFIEMYDEVEEIEEVEECEGCGQEAKDLNYQGLCKSCIEEREEVEEEAL